MHPKKSIVEHRVYYSDTDHGGVVYYANYLRWFEIGRTEVLRQNGFDYEDFEKQGIMAPVVEVHCSYKSPARYNNVVIIKTSIEKIGNSSIKFNYEVLRKSDDKLLASGSTVNVFVDKKTVKPVRIPDSLRKALEAKQ